MDEGGYSRIGKLIRRCLGSLWRIYLIAIGGKSVGEVGDGLGFGEGVAVHGVAELGGGFVGFFTGAHDVAQGAVGFEGVEGVEGEEFVYVDAAGGGVRVLGGRGQGGDRMVGALGFGPFDGGVFDGHGFEVGAELGFDGPLGGLGFEEFGDGVAQAGEVEVDVDVFVEEVFEVLGGGFDDDFGDVVAEADSGAGAVGFAEGVGFGVAELGEGGGLGADEAKDGVGAAGEIGDEFFEEFGVVGVFFDDVL